jgi:hypothetical protein
VLSPPTASLEQIQRLFGYLRSVLEADLRPENLHLTPDVEELARGALRLPPSQRTLFQIVRNLRVGVFKARLIKTVESAGTAVHAPLPSLDLGAFSPEFDGATPTAGAPADSFFAPENVPAPHGPGAPAEVATVSHVGTAVHPHGGRHGPPARCVGCGGIASVVHQCGATMCQHCIAEFHTCPKCQQEVTSINSRPVGDAPGPAGVAHPGAQHPSSGLRSVVARLKPGGKPAPPKTARSSGTPHGGSPVEASQSDGPGGRPTAETRHADPVPDPVPPPPRPAHPREKKDDEPRL